MATSVQAGFEKVLSIQGLTNRQQLLAADRHSALRTFFNSNFDMDRDVFEVGSYSRGTMAREKDIDFMAIMDPYGASEYWDAYKDDSSRFLYKVRDALNDRYGKTKVSSRRVAVKLDFTEIVTDVTPGFPRKGGGFLIPNGSGGWMGTTPPVHKAFIDEANKATGYRLKRAVQLLKYWNTQNGGHLMSFHLELLTEMTYRSGVIADSWAYAIKEAFRCMPTWLRTSVQDPWPDGGNVASYLSTEKRDLVIRKLESAQKKAEEALSKDKQGYTWDAFALWDEIFADGFAAYG